MCYDKGIVKLSHILMMALHTVINCSFWSTISILEWLPQYFMWKTTIQYYSRFILEQGQKEIVCLEKETGKKDTKMLKFQQFWKLFRFSEFSLANTYSFYKLGKNVFWKESSRGCKVGSPRTDGISVGSSSFPSILLSTGRILEWVPSPPLQTR